MIAFQYTISLEMQFSIAVFLLRHVKGLMNGRIKYKLLDMAFVMWLWNNYYFLNMKTNDTQIASFWLNTESMRWHPLIKLIYKPSMVLCWTGSLVNMYLHAGALSQLFKYSFLIPTYPLSQIKLPWKPAVKETNAHTKHRMVTGKSHNWKYLSNTAAKHREIKQMQI